jgi:hypothetical protein
MGCTRAHDEEGKETVSPSSFVLRTRLEIQSGLSVGTLVHTIRGCRPVETFSVGEKVWAYDEERQRWRLAQVRVVARRCFTTDVCRIRLVGDQLTVAADQLVWAAEVESGRWRWFHARDLQSGNTLPSLRRGTLAVLENVLGEEEVCVVEVQITGLHSFSVGSAGVVVHNRNPSLAAGQALVLTVQQTGTQFPLTLPPIDEEHIFQGCIPHGTTDLEGLHHFASPDAIQKGVPILVNGHSILTTDASGTQGLRTVDLRIVPVISTTRDAPFDAEVEVIDPVNKAVLATKIRSSFFPMNWMRTQVIQAIYETLTNYVTTTGRPPVGRSIAAMTDFKVRLELRVTGNAGIPTLVYSGYPQGPQLRVTSAQAPQ